MATATPVAAAPSASDRGRSHPSTYTIAQPPSHWFDIPAEPVTSPTPTAPALSRDPSAGVPTARSSTPVSVSAGSRDLLSAVNDDDDAVTLVNGPGAMRGINNFDRRASLHAALVAEHQAAAAALAARAEHDRLERRATREAQIQAAKSEGGIAASLDSWNRWSAKFYMPWINRYNAQAGHRR